MKKYLALILGCMLFLAACGDDNEDSNGSASGSEQVEGTTNEESDNQDNEDSNGEVSDTSFDTGDYVYEIKEVEQITGKYDDKQVLALEISFTNNTDQPTSPWMALGIKAEQETDVTVESLNGANGQFPEDYKPDLVEMGDTDIKPGATVDAVIGFEIIYPGEPVKLTNFSFTDEVLFEKVVETE